MNEFVGTSPWVTITQDVARKRRGPIAAAVSYVGVRAPEVLPLRKGDFLICDASTKAIKQGVTSAKSLASYLRLGVRVFSYEGLHSKVVASEKFAWVGSANASGNSRDSLIEASVRVEGPTCRVAFKWAESLATEDAELSVQDVRALAKLPVSWQAKGGEASRRKAILEWPKGLEKLFIVGLTRGVPAYMWKEAEKQKVDIKKSLQTQGSRLDNFFWTAKLQGASAGDWVVPVTDNRVGKPGRIVKISQFPKFSIFWYQELKTPVRQKIADLRNCVDALDMEEDVRVITDKRQISKIRKMYGL